MFCDYLRKMMSVRDNGTFWHRQREEITFQTVLMWLFFLYMLEAHMYWYEYRANARMRFYIYKAHGSAVGWSVEFFFDRTEQNSFWRKNPKKKFSSCFGLDSALKTINTQLLFCSIFLKTHQKKVIYRQKNAILAIFEN